MGDIGDQGNQAYRLAKAGELSEEALDQIRKGIIDKRRELFKENEKQVEENEIVGKIYARYLF